MAESLPPPPAFTPVPVRARRDGWTPARQLRFIEMLVETRSPTRAARAVGMTKESAYALRRRVDAASFVAAWDAALARPPAAALEPGLYERGVEGILEPIFHGGLQRGWRRRYDDKAFLRLLRIASRNARRLERSGG